MYFEDFGIFETVFVDVQMHFELFQIHKISKLDKENNFIFIAFIQNLNT